MEKPKRNEPQRHRGRNTEEKTRNRKVSILDPCPILSFVLPFLFLCVLCASVVRLSCEFHRPRFADDRDLDLARIVQLFLDRPGDVVADLDRVAVAGL